MINEAAIEFIRSNSATFWAKIWKETIKYEDMLKIFEQLCPDPQDLRVKVGLIYPSDEAAIVMPEPIPNEKGDQKPHVRSLIQLEFITAKNRISRIYYVYVNERYWDSHQSKWFLTGHELGHFCLHRRWIRMTKLSNPMSATAEEEADLFSRLCLWPMDTIAEELSKKPHPLSREEVIKHLLDYAKEHGINTDNGPKHKRIAYNFLIAFERAFPDKYRAFAAKVF